MNKLIFALLFLLPVSVLAADEILSDADIEKKFITVAKETEVEKILAQTTEFQKAIKDAKFSATDTPDQRHAKALKAESILKQDLSKRDPESLKKLSDKLGLESYGLVESKKSADITKYLADKLYESLTGIDRKEKQNAESLKFENRKMIDQKVFIDLYVNHVAKSVLFEISRYCFENFRTEGVSDTGSFVEHWQGYFRPAGSFPANVTDTGTGGFGSKNLDGDPKKAYEEMFKGITGNATVDTDKLGKFFGLCGSKMNELCNGFKNALPSATAPVDPVIKADAKSNMPKGATSCIAISRLQEAKKGLANAKAVQKQFESDFQDGSEVALDNGSQPQFFRPEANTIDELSTVTSFDYLNNSEDDKAKLCAATPESSGCDKFIEIGDARAKAEHGIEINLGLKKEVEMARIRAFKDDKEGIEKYLSDNGYMDLLEGFKNKTLDSAKIEAAIGKSFDAKRAALLASIKDKIGSRQLTESEAGDDVNKKSLIQKNAKEVQSERARMSQVVLFNNILTGFLDATDEKGNSFRYGTTWKKEQKSLEGEANVNDKFFSGFKQSFKDDEGGTKGNIANIEFLDQFLGAPPKPKP